jgi:type II secretory pathway pseudopilin PulG
VPARHKSAGFTIIETLFVVGLIGIISAIAVPSLNRTVASLRLTGDARGLTNAIAVAKIRAASKFTRVRLFVNLSDNSHFLQTLDRSTSPPSWITEGGATYLSTLVDFGYAPVTSPPPNSQPSIAQAVQCVDDDGDPIANSACITFNSRGVPVDATGAANSLGALYVTDGTAVYGVTAAASGMIRLWRTFPTVTPNWVLQ